MLPAKQSRSSEPDGIENRILNLLEKQNILLEKLLAVNNAYYEMFRPMIRVSMAQTSLLNSRFRALSILINTPTEIAFNEGRDDKIISILDDPNGTSGIMSFSKFPRVPLDRALTVDTGGLSPPGAINLMPPNQKIYALQSVSAAIDIFVVELNI